MRTIIIDASQKFFYEMVVFFGAFSALGSGLIAQHGGSVRCFRPGECIKILGSSHVSNEELLFCPYDIFNPILAGGWPGIIEIRFEPIIKAKPASFKKITGIRRLHMTLIQIAFINYFEKTKPIIKNKYGTNWPPVWNFASVIRNALAHGGRIRIDDPDAKRVSWMTLTYSPLDNGKQIMYQDIRPVELILLMVEMDSAA